MGGYVRFYFSKIYVNIKSCIPYFFLLTRRYPTICRKWGHRFFRLQKLFSHIFYWPAYMKAKFILQWFTWCKLVGLWRVKTFIMRRDALWIRFFTPRCEMSEITQGLYTKKGVDKRCFKGSVKNLPST